MSARRFTNMEFLTKGARTSWRCPDGFWLLLNSTVPWQSGQIQPKIFATSPFIGLSVHSYLSSPILLDQSRSLFAHHNASYVGVFIAVFLFYYASLLIIQILQSSLMRAEAFSPIIMQGCIGVSIAIFHCSFIWNTFDSVHKSQILQSSLIRAEAFSPTTTQSA